jgi:curved DNA-binding protein CbpA
MSFEIQRGLFGHDVTDHYAILGIPLGTDPKTVRKRFLQIAPRLHPDTCSAANAQGKAYAQQLMSRLVNPAYATLSNDAKRADYEAVLRTLHSRLPQQANKVAIQGALARELSQAANVQGTYLKALQTLTASQYDDLEQVLNRIAEISELNLVYLLKTTSGSASPARPAAAPPPPPPAQRPASTPSSGGETTGAREGAASNTQFVLRALHRAEELTAKGQFAMAMQELKDALKIDGNNADCHAWLGKVYLAQKQGTLAKVHLTRALAIDPRNAIALAAKQELDRATGGQTTGQATGQTAKTTKPQPKTIGGGKDKPGGGLFGGLFGRKK